MSRVFLTFAVASALVSAACSQPAPATPPARYPIAGQVLAVNTEARKLTVKHGDIEGLMPGMTMTFDVASPTDLVGREPGDLIAATLEVSSETSRLLDVVRTGSAPLPSNTNEVALVAGLLEVGDAIPDAALIDQADRRRSLSEWHGTTTLVSFTYTTCPLPNFCPLIDRNFAALQELIASDPALAGRVKLISISIDPTTDTPAVLAAHAARLKANPDVWTMLTGDVVTSDRVAGRFGVGIVRPDQPGEIKHNLRTTLVGKNARVRAIYSGNEWTPTEMVADLRASVAAAE